MPTTFWRTKSQTPNIIDNFLKTSLKSAYRPQTQGKADRIYVTAFLDKPTFRKFVADIAWETEVWIADNPEHLIHFDGDKFLGPYG